jgi:NAD(P)-dependent dehydrogenase (short-subunit alcohol dehydrogenase family)
MKNVTVITGAAGNLGKAVTAKMANEGFQVVGTVLPGKADNVQSEDQVIYKEVDLMDAKEVDKLIREVYSSYGNIHSVICLTGGFDMAGISEATDNDLQKMIDLNFNTAFHVIQPVLNLVKDQDELVKIVLIGAKPAFEPGGARQVFPYALSKSMVVKMAELINAASKKLNATATVIVPSIIDTPANRKAMPDADFSSWVKPESIAEKIAFICSDKGKDLRESVLKIYGNS